MMRKNDMRNFIMKKTGEVETKEIGQVNDTF